MKRTYTIVKTLTGKPRKFRKWADYTVGDILICKYLGPIENKFSKEKPNYLVEIYETFLKDKKTQEEWVEGTHVVLNSAGILQRGLSKIAEQSLVQITFQGSNIMKGGNFPGKEAYAVEVIEIREDEVEKDEEGSSHDEVDL